MTMKKFLITKLYNWVDDTYARSYLVDNDIEFLENEKKDFENWDWEILWDYDTWTFEFEYDMGDIVTYEVQEITI